MPAEGGYSFADVCERSSTSRSSGTRRRGPAAAPADLPRGPAADDRAADAAPRRPGRRRRPTRPPRRRPAGGPLVRRRSAGAVAVRAGAALAMLARAAAIYGVARRRRSASRLQVEGATITDEAAVRGGSRLARREPVRARDGPARGAPRARSRPSPASRCRSACRTRLAVGSASAARSSSGGSASGATWSTRAGCCSPRLAEDAAGRAPAACRSGDDRAASRGLSVGCGSTRSTSTRRPASPRSTRPTSAARPGLAVGRHRRERLRRQPSPGAGRRSSASTRRACGRPTSSRPGPPAAQPAHRPRAAGRAVILADDRRDLHPREPRRPRPTPRPTPAPRRRRGSAWRRRSVG